MKQIKQIIFTTLLFSASAFGITPEKTYNYICNSTMLNNTEYKYYIMDFDQNQCRIYNTDYSLYKTINLSIPSGKYLYDIRFVTQDLFDTDEKIELLYVYYDYNSTGEYYTYYTKVINEDGTELISVDGGLYSYMYMVNATEYRLFIYSYDYSSWPYDMSTNIYNLPGYPYLLKNDEVSSKSANIGDAYPNPASNFVTVNYSLPENVTEAQLNIYNMNGQQVETYTVDRHFQALQLPVDRLPSGEYLYNIESQGQRSESKKLIVR